MNLITSSHEIPEFKLSSLEFVIAKLNKRAKRLGLPPTTIKVGARSVRKCGEGERVWTAIEITGVEPVIDGWQFVATFEHDAETGLTIIRRSPNFEGEIPTQYRSGVQSCEHCNHKRARKDTFLLLKDGVWKQVGRNCLRAFIGYGDPHLIAEGFSFWQDIAEILHGADEDEGWRECTGNKGEIALPLDLFLDRCFSVTRVHGFIGRVKAREQEKYATADRALDLEFPHPRDRQEDKWKAAELETRPNEADKANTQGALAWVRAMDFETLSEYLSNLFIACAGEVFTSRRAGIVASLPAAYLRHLDREAELARERANRPASAHVGQIGERLKGLVLKVENIFANQGDFGITYITKFREENTGNAFTWFASGIELDKGATYKVIGTVKKHDEYKGELSTVLSRCKTELV